MKQIFRNIIALAILAGTLSLAILFPAFFLGEVWGLESKNVTISIEKRDFIYCWFGSPDSANGICDKLDLDKRQLDEVDNFLEAFARDRVERSYKVEVP